jgi:predicted dehydrogenase
VEAFVRVIQGEEERDLGRVDDAVAVMAVIEAAHQASARGTDVQLPSPLTV